MWKAHKGMILASAFAGTNNRPTYITGSNDSTVALWDTLGRAKETSDSSTTHGSFLYINELSASADQYLPQSI